MYKSFLVLMALNMTLAACGQKTEHKSMNLGFEILKDGKAADWTSFGDENGYVISQDTTIFRSGKYAATIEYDDNYKQGYKALSYIIPQNYNGKQITLSGYLKTENVSGGWAGLWLRIDPGIGFNNMQEQNVTGTTEWTKYEISVNMDPKNTKQIVIGCLLVGKGKIWVDDLQITIDGKDIKELTPVKVISLPGEKDKEFDSSSKIKTITLDGQKIENLKLLGQIWGFLKYYHPNIAKGDYNWDYELFRITPQILQVSNRKKRDEMLLNWINKFGTFKEAGNEIQNSGLVKSMPDLFWISHSHLSEPLVARLTKIKNAERTGEHFYIELARGVSNPVFKHENPYLTMKYPDAGFRLLTLFRYWNMIAYYNPNKHLIGENWENVLQEFIPKFVLAANETDYTIVTLKLIARIHDTHGQLFGKDAVLNKYKGNYIAPVELSFIENKAVVTGFFNDSLATNIGLEKGDIVTKINYKTIQDIIKEKAAITPASNAPTQLRDIAIDLLRTNDSVLNIEFEHHNIKKKKKLSVYSIDIINNSINFMSSDTCFKMISPEIAYINNSSLKTKYIPELWKKIKNTKGLILDLRNYPSDFPIYDLGNLLVSTKTTFVRYTNGSIKQPGFFFFGDIGTIGNYNIESYKGKVIILVNERTQSSAEYHAMAYKMADRSIILGSTTAGADGNVSTIQLPGGISTWISGIGILYPDCKETQRVGIVPDIVMTPTINGIKKGKDELMDKAIFIINNPWRRR